MIYSDVMYVYAMEKHPFDGINGGGGGGGDLWDECRGRMGGGGGYLCRMICDYHAYHKDMLAYVSDTTHVI